MELVTPSATTTADVDLPRSADTDAPATGAELRLRTALLGLLGKLGNRGRSRTGRSVLRDPPPGRVVLRHARRSLRISGRTVHSRLASLALVFGGLILLSRVWFGLLRHLNAHRGFPVKRVVLVVMIWAIPLLLAPPLFSRDVYTYAAQGEMMSHHINPYSYGPEVLGSTSLNQDADAVWSGTESPYGPTFLSVDGVLDQASGHQILPDLVLLRLLEVGGIAMVVAATPTLARALKHDPAHAVMIGAGSPLVLLSLIGGAHNDALMLGLLMAGLAVATRFGTVPGVILCALAAGVKSPALLGVLFLGWVWAGAGRFGPPPRRPHRGGGAHRAGHHGGRIPRLGHRLGLGPHDDDRRRILHRSDAGQRGGPRRLHRQSRLPGSRSRPLTARPIFSVLGLLIAAYVGYRMLLRSRRTASSAASVSRCWCWRSWVRSCGPGT